MDVYLRPVESFSAIGTRGVRLMLSNSAAFPALELYKGYDALCVAMRQTRQLALGRETGIIMTNC